MRTDYFDTSAPGALGEDEDETLLPDENPALAIDDIFDITAEGTIPPASVVLDDDEDLDGQEDRPLFKR